MALYLLTDKLKMQSNKKASSANQIAAYLEG